MSEDINIIMNNFTKELKKARQNAFLSQAKVAKSLGISPQRYGKYEDGTNRMYVERLICFCQLLGINVGDFLNKCIYYDQHMPTSKNEDQERLWLYHIERQKGIITDQETIIKALLLQIQDLERLQELKK